MIPEAVAQEGTLFAKRLGTKGFREPRWSQWSIPDSLGLPLWIRQSPDAVALPNVVLS